MVPDKRSLFIVDWVLIASGEEATYVMDEQHNAYLCATKVANVFQHIIKFITEIIPEVCSLFCNNIFASKLFWLSSLMKKAVFSTKNFCTKCKKFTRVAELEQNK